MFVELKLMSLFLLQSIVDRVKSETKGDFEKLLVTIVGAAH